MDLREYIDGLLPKDLLEVSRKIFAEKAADFSDYLPQVKSPDELLHILYIEIDNLPVISLNKILRHRDIILEEEVNNPSKDFDIIINNIIRLSSKYKEQLQYSILLNAIQVKEIKKNIKLKLALFLSNNSEISEQVFIQLTKQNNFLLPALMNRTRFANPRKALEYLDEFLNENSEKVILKPQIRSLLLNYLSIENFSLDNYEHFIFLMDGAKPGTQTLVNEILELEQLKGIKEKINSVSDELIHGRIGKIFLPQELESARELVTAFSSRKNVSNQDVLSQNIYAVVYVIAELITEKKEEKVKAIGSLFQEFHRLYERKFFVYLKKYGVTYDPMEHGVHFGDQLYPFTIELDSFKATQQELIKKNGPNRIQRASTELSI
jgi:hypothetical protein